MNNLATSIASNVKSLEDRLKAVTPVRSGNLRDSISASVDNEAISIEALYYAKYVNARTNFIDKGIVDSDLEDMADKIIDDLFDDIKNNFK